MKLRAVIILILLICLLPGRVVRALEVPESEALLTVPAASDNQETAPSGFEQGIAAYRQGDFRAALSDWQELAEQGYGPALHNLGVLYEYGRGTNPDYTRAARYYERAATFEIPQALNNLARLYAGGLGVAKNEKRAVRLLSQASDLGFPEARFNLGIAYLKGRGIRKDAKQAVRLFEAAAEAGYGPAQYNLAGMYHRGQGVHRDLVQALKWYEMAAASGDPLAHYGAAMIGLSKGALPMPANLVIRHLRLAADAGVADAQNQLGIVYARGRLVTADQGTAMMWFLIAASIGNPQAERNRDLLARRLAGDVLTKARRRALAFRPTALTSARE